MWTSAVALLCALTTPLLQTSAVTSPFVAFSVGKTQRQLTNGRVQFDKIFLNAGGAFKTRTNAFIAPVNGIYQITVSAINYVEGDIKKTLWVDLYKNKEYILSVYESSDFYGQASNTALLLLSKNDEVYLDMSRCSSCGLFGLPNQVYTTFSGYMIATANR